MKPYSVSKEGVYDVPDDIYYSDTLCKGPTLSASILKILINETAAKAWMSHPRLNPNYEPENKYIFDKGDASHLVMLGSAGKIKVLHYKDFKTKAAQDERDHCYETGVIPILEKDWNDVQEMARVGRIQLDRHDDAHDFFRGGKSEQTLVWREDNGVICRCKLDWLPQRIGNVFPDYKSTGTLAGPDDWGRRQLFDTGCDIQDAFYSRGLQKVLGLDHAELHFVVQENKPPFALAVHAVSPMGRSQAMAEVENGIKYWGWCLGHNAWPGWAKHTYQIDPPVWYEKERETRRIERQAYAESKIDQFKLLTDWQAPLQLPNKGD